MIAPTAPAPSRRKPIRVGPRLAGGVAFGSPSAQAQERRRGRPRKHLSNAEKQKEYRKNLQKKFDEKYRKSRPQDDAMNYARTGGYTTIAGGALDFIDANARRGPQDGIPTKPRTSYTAEGEVIGADQLPDHHKEHDDTFVKNHLTKAVLKAFVRERGHLDKVEAERMVRDLSNWVFGSDNCCNQCDKVVESGHVMHLWTDHVDVIRLVLKEAASARGCPKAFHQLLFEYPQERIQAKCPICGKTMTQKGIVNPFRVMETKAQREKRKADEKAATQAALFQDVLRTLHVPTPAA